MCLLPVCASWNDPRAPPGRGVVHGCRDLNGAVNILKIFKQYVLDGSRPKYLQRPRKGTQGGWWIVVSAWAGEGGGTRQRLPGEQPHALVCGGQRVRLLERAHDWSGCDDAHACVCGRAGVST